MESAERTCCNADSTSTWSSRRSRAQLRYRCAANRSGRRSRGIAAGVSDRRQNRFCGRIAPVVTAGKTPKAKFDLSPYRSLEAVAGDLGHWKLVLKRLAEKDMPPKAAKANPDEKLRDRVVGWIRRLRRHEAQKNAGDPGPVLARRLSNAEYNYAIRDLTGVDIRPTRDFPIDPANKAGFDNSGESLTMSPALLKKYLTAAREVAKSSGAAPGWNHVRPASRSRLYGSRQVLRAPYRELL